jgi:mRNA-degrading endonuclease toxin of MazEF toxin-antitoxin module
VAGKVARGDVRLYQFALLSKKKPLVVLLGEDGGMKAPCAVNLHNAVTVSQGRLGKRVAQLSSARMHETCVALRFALGCDANPS